MKKVSEYILGGALLIGVALAIPLSGAATALKGDLNSDLAIEAKGQINQVSDYLNAIDTMSGDFMQTNPDGSLVEGKFYMRRPGRVRFEYDDPAMTLMSDGTWAMINDRVLESVDRYPLLETPLYLLLKRDVDLLKDAEISAVEHGNGLIAITAAETSGIALGTLTLIFAEPNLELRYWVVTDVNGDSTVVMLRNVERGMALDPALFLPEEGDIFGDDDFE
jgi:outer membrane lipoprotein-sorting protein